MSSQQIKEALDSLNLPTTLKIISLSEPILSSTSRDPSSSDETNINTPASLEADLAHYRDLFSKLRFSCVEQVTKERFLKAIVADPPELVDSTQTASLEAKLAVDKAALKTKKVAMENMISDLELLGKRLAQSYEIIALQTTQLASLPREISSLESHISSLVDRTTHTPPSSNPDLNLSLPETQSLLASRKSELELLDRQIRDLEASALPERKREVERLQAESAPLEERKRKAVDEAREARRKRGGDGGLAVELEERGRWLKSVQDGLTTMLNV